MIRIVRAYDMAHKREGGQRFLVDRLWPRGLKKEALEPFVWTKEAAPSNDLRKWFGHDPQRWAEFQRRYKAELDENPEAWRPILDAARDGDVLLIYGAKDEEHNQAVALKAYLEHKVRASA